MTVNRNSDRFALLAAFTAVSLIVSACSKSENSSGSAQQSADGATDAQNTAVVAPAASATAAAAPAAKAPPSADSTDTLSGAKFADFTGDATAGATVFLQCKTCHVIDPGVNHVGPSLHGIIGRKASSIADFRYSPANHASGITWTEEKLFQYLENPQRVVPGTFMTFTGVKDPQKRADVIAYLKANS